MTDFYHTLDSLPAELLHRVALFLPCSSILNVCFTNRRLYATCYDRLVFKHSAANAIFEDRYDKLIELDKMSVEDWESETCASGASEEDSEDEEWWLDVEEEGLSPEEDWDFNNWGPNEYQRRIAECDEWYLSWPDAAVFDSLSARDSARIAYAVEKAQRYLNVVHTDEIRDWTEKWDDASLPNWLPHLLALRHFSCLGLRPETLSQLLWQPGSTTDDRRPDRNESVSQYVTSSFCILALMLVRLETLPRARSFQDHHFDIRESFWEFDPRGDCIAEHLNWKLHDLPNGDIRMFDFAVDTYALLTYLLFTFYPFQTMTDKPFPSLCLLPFSSTAGIPIPFRDPPEKLTQVDLKGDVLLNYLNGEWTGWSTDNRYPLSYEVGPPFKDFHIITQESILSDAPGLEAVFEDGSRGEDFYGLFALNGTVSAEGEIWMTKKYAEDANAQHNPQSFHRLRGVVTPFGITGAWEEDAGIHSSGKRMLRHRGFFWLWKIEWCGPDWSSCPWQGDEIGHH